MLTSITPLGERGRARRWRVSAPSLVAGSLLGGLGIGALAGAIGVVALSGLGVLGAPLDATARLRPACLASAAAPAAPG